MPKSARDTVFDPAFLEDLQWWVKTDNRTARRLLELVQAVMDDPFGGIGKPEPLKFELSGCWSRRITQEHRVVYKVYDDRITFLQGRYHY
jgi:toxin YoeB